MNPKRLLIVTSEFPPQPGGIGNHAHNLAKYLSLEGIEVTLLADQRSERLEEDLNFDRKQHYRVCRVPKASPRFPMYFSRLRKLFTLSKSADMVIASGKFSLWSVGLLSLFRKKSYIAVTHGTEVNFKSHIPKFLVSLSLKRFDEVIAVSNFTKRLMSSLSLYSIKVIPNGFDLSDWESNTTPASLSGNPKLVTIGHVSERKGQGHVIQLLPELMRPFPNLHYHCVGIPTEAQKFKDLAQDLGVLGRVTFHGRLSTDDLQSVLLGSDVCVLMSGETHTGDVEGFGIALLEANALGVPVIAAKGSGVEDAVAHGYSGFLVPLNDPQAFSDALKRLLDDKGKFSHQAKHWAEGFQWEVVVKKYIEVLNDLDVRRES